ncbi:MAG TPA: hypothetical protein VFJ89_06600 [Nocardioides sp.]|nr:hypothetical protein [Nocardioides sp.]
MTRFVRRALGGAVGGAVSVALLAGTLLLAPAASAAPGPCAPTTFKQDVKKADVVFRGVVTKVGKVRGKGDQRMRNYKVEADRVYQASLVGDRVIVTAAVGTDCDVPLLDKNARYIFFVTEDGSRLLATRATAKATHSLTRKVVAKLGDGAQPEPTPQPSAVFTKVADASPPSLSRLLAPGAALVIVSLLGLLVVGRLGRRTT